MSLLSIYSGVQTFSVREPSVGQRVLGRSWRQINFYAIIEPRAILLERSVSRMGEERGVYRVFLGKPEGNRPLGRPRRRWVANIRMDLQEVGCGYMDWIGLAQDRDRWRTLVSAVMNLRGSVKCGEFLD